MSDREFLDWLWRRLVFVHKEKINYDYMRRLRKIIDTYEPVQVKE